MKLTFNSLLLSSSIIFSGYLHATIQTKTEEANATKVADETIELQTDLTSVKTTSKESLETFDINQYELPKLSQESQHSLASIRIFHVFTREHYKNVKVDDTFSAKIFDRYIKQLDYNKLFFLAKDIEALSVHQNSFDEALYRGELNFVYDIYAKNLQRRKEMFAYALSLLDKEMDFNLDEYYFYDREDSDWAQTTEELKEIWRQKVKFDALNLKLADKDWEKTKELLGKRYKTAIKRLTQSKSEDVFQIAMNAFARSIEAHTSYLSPRNADRFDQQINLSLEGIGAVLYIEDDYTIIRELVPGAPAERSEKIKPKDKIVGVAQKGEDFVDVVGWRLDDVVELIKGPKGSQVTLQIVKGDSADNKTIEVAITRDKIRLEDQEASSKVYIPESGPYQDRKMGVIEFSGFYNGLTKHVVRELKSLKAQNIEGLVIDLRGNGGGSLPESISLTGLFIDKGPVVQVRSVGNKINVYNDTHSGALYNGPLVVMVDRYSASASEIFAAAIQDYGRGIVVGEQTFGKGTVQSARPLKKPLDFLSGALGNIHYTFAKFYRINGGSTQNKGVVPDILFPTPIDAQEWGESNEDNALPWDEIRQASYRQLGKAPETKIKMLTERHQARINESPEFKYVFEDIAEFKKDKDKKSISLNYKARLAERDENKAKRLKRENERLVRQGKPPVASLDELDKSDDAETSDDALSTQEKTLADKEETAGADKDDEKAEKPDIFLDETANIMFDYIAQLSKKNHQLAQQE